MLTEFVNLGWLKILLSDTRVNPPPPMPILDSSNSAANKTMMSKIWTNGVQLSD